MSNGEKFPICVFAEVVKSETKSTGNSIIDERGEGFLPYHASITFF